MTDLSKGARCADVARHTRGKHEPRRLFIKCRVTPDERARLHELMRKTGHRSEADFIRDAIFKVKPIVIRSVSPTDDEIWDQMKKLVGEFNRIGTNYNQIVHKANNSNVVTTQEFKDSSNVFNSLICKLENASKELQAYLLDMNKRL